MATSQCSTPTTGTAAGPATAPSGEVRALIPACRCVPPRRLDADRKWPLVLLGDTHLGGAMDTNGSTESFELVTEDNNGEGKAKTDRKNVIYVQT